MVSGFLLGAVADQDRRVEQVPYLRLGSSATREFASVVAGTVSGSGGFLSDD